MTTPSATARVGGSPFGRIPSLTANIRELIHDYPEGIGIIKELAQNADDAGARLLEVIIDRRSHAAKSLPAPGMAVLQGPALLFINDSVFTEDDFDRIQEIFRSGKVRAADKTGQFGKGFNTVYNLTDWPSFVTGDRVAFFDPHCSLVPGADRINPGRYWTLAECWDQFPDLLAPFSAAGLEHGATRFEGTAFRLPFRTAAQAARSEISRKPFGEENLNGLIAEMAEVRESLLLFLKRLESVRLREVSTTGVRRDLVIVETTNVEEVRGKRDELLAALRGDAADVVRRLQGRPPVLVSYHHEFRTSWVVQQSTPATQDSTWRVLHCLNLDGGGKLAETVDAMLSNDVKAVPLGGAAARVVPVPDGKTPPSAIGRVYCSLPLPIETGLPVHLNGFFDLDSSRHTLTTESSLTGSARVRGRWNRLLVEHVVAPAYAHLIDHLSEDVGIEDAPSYYNHWPRPDRPMAAPLDALVVSVYRVLVQRQPTACLSGSVGSTPKCLMTRSRTSSAVSVRSGSTIARFPCIHFGSIGFSHGALTGRPHTRIRHPDFSRRTRRLCPAIQARTRLLTCQAALSQTRTNTRLPSAANCSHAQARKSSVTWLTGRPSTNRTIIRPVSRR